MGDIANISQYLLALQCFLLVLCKKKRENIFKRNQYFDPLVLHVCQKKRLLEPHSTPGLKPCKMAKGKLELAASGLGLGVGPHWAHPLFCIAVPAQIKERAFPRLEYR